MIQDPIIAAIVKYKRNPSIFKITNKTKLKVTSILNKLMITNGRAIKRFKWKKSQKRK